MMLITKPLWCGGLTFKYDGEDVNCYDHDKHASMGHQPVTTATTVTSIDSVEWGFVLADPSKITKAFANIIRMVITNDMSKKPSRSSRDSRLGKGK